MSRGSAKRIAAAALTLTAVFLAWGHATAWSSHAAPLASRALALSPPTSSQQPSLEGTSWQLVQFKGGDDTTLIPDDGSKYTIEFAPEGQLYARVDCNRGRGTWKSAGDRLELGPLTITRVKCAKGSLHDQIVKQWESVRSYVIQNDHLFLSLVADGGIYEFEPIRRSRAAAVPETEFRGIVSALTGVCPALRLTVSGTSVSTGGSTRFDSACQSLRIGSVVEVKGSRAADGSVVALSIEIEDDMRRERR